MYILVFTYKLPQMYTLYKVKKTTGLSLFSLFIQLVSYTLYIIHGVFVEDTSLSIGMIPPLFQNLVLISMYLYYQNINTTPVESNEGWYIRNCRCASGRYRNTHGPFDHIMAIRLLFQCLLISGYKYTGVILKCQRLANLSTKKHATTF